MDGDVDGIVVDDDAAACASPPSSSADFDGGFAALLGHSADGVGLAAPPLPDPLPLVGLWVGWSLAPSLPASGEFG